MKYKVVIRPEAEFDLKESFSWYEDKREGLGHDFLLQIDAGFKQLERNPFICQQEYKVARKLLIRRFPYKIIYIVEKESIFILAVIHGKRSSDLIINRVDNI